ncbi:MAG: hypothetical protein P1U34_09400 [Coxiellaceae bacterium]|nr:hypothetical protein [Coxiellaceae bacterium]
MKKMTCLLAATVSVGLLTVSAISIAKPLKFPKGCRTAGAAYEQGYLALRPDYTKQKRTLYLIHNLTSYNLELKSLKDPKDLFTPHYDQTLPRHKWAAFAMDRDQIHFKCVHVKNKSTQIPVRCDGLFAICEYDNVKFPHASMGTYWIEKTGNLRQTMRHAIREGILLRW